MVNGEKSRTHEHRHTTMLPPPGSTRTAATAGTIRFICFSGQVKERKIAAAAPPGGSCVKSSEALIYSIVNLESLTKLTTGETWIQFPNNICFFIYLVFFCFVFRPGSDRRSAFVAALHRRRYVGI